MTSAYALYVYGFVPHPTGSWPTDVPAGVTEHQPLALLHVASANASALYELTPLTDWTGEEAQQRLSNLEWVAPRALRHEAVVTWAHEHLGPILPASLGTIFSSEQTLSDEVIARAGDLATYFARVAGCDQWTFKAFADLAAVERFLQGDAASKPASGADYLRRKAAARQTEGLESFLQTRSRAIFDDLRELAVDHDFPTRRPGGKDTPVMVWHFLVPRQQREAFVDRFEQQATTQKEIGLELFLSGPSAPYGFRP
jgi:hypothetical protein